MSNSTCWNSTLLQKPFKITEHLIVFKIIVPFYLVFGLFGHFSLLIAVYKRSKKERAYFYQVARAIIETLEVVVRSLYCTHDSIWLADEFYIPPFLARCYGCIWFAARLLTFMANTLLTLTLFLSVCMVADRVFALAKPVVYRSINRPLHEAVAMVVSVVLSIAFAIIDLFRFDINQSSEGAYSYGLNKAFLESPTISSLGLCRVAAQVFLFFLLFILSVALVWLYHLRFTSSDGKPELRHDLEKRKQEEKVLTVLTLLECILNAIGMIVVMSSILMVYAFPSFYACIKQVFAPLVDGVLMIVDVADFYAAFLVSKRFRQIVRQAFSCGANSNSVSVIVTNTAA